MRAMKKFWAAAALSAGLSVLMTGTAFANFSYNVGNKYVGTADAVFTDYGEDFEERVVIIQDGADVILTPKIDGVVFSFMAYDVNGSLIMDDSFTYLEAPISGELSAGTPVTFIAKSHLTKAEDPQYLTLDMDNVNVGAYKILMYDAAADWYYWSYLVIDGVYNKGIMDNVELKWDKTYSWKMSDEGKWQVTSADGISLSDEWYRDPNSGNYYYLDRNCNMLTDTVTPDGYYVNGDGVWVQN